MTNGDLKWSVSSFNLPSHVIRMTSSDDKEFTWTNHGLECFKQHKPNVDIEAVVKNQYEDAKRKENVLVRAGFRMKKGKLRLLYSGDAIPQKGKPCHPRGVGGSGYAVVVDNPKFPEHEFFRPGRIFPVRMRHSNASFEDDAMVDGRVACIKFGDTDQGSPLDLILRTGRVGLYHNAEAFEGYRDAFLKGGIHTKAWCLQQPTNYFARVDHMRREPTSYHDQIYHSHVVYTFVSKQNQTLLARLRLLADDLKQETGLLSQEDQENVWECDRREDTGLPSNYLRKEYTERINTGPVKYKIQIQLCNPKESPDDLDIYNPCLEWQDPTPEWLDLATITLFFHLPEDLILKTKFSLTHYPPSFYIPEATSTRDFRSVATATADLHGSIAENGDLDDGVKENKEETNNVTYSVTIETGNEKNAGNDSTVYITITGTEGRTGPICLENVLHHFQQVPDHAMEVTAPPVGDMITVQLDLQSASTYSEWLIEYVTITEKNSKKDVRFHGYGWLTTHEPTFILRRAEAILPQREQSDFSYLQRKYEVEARREKYHWEKVEGLPGRIRAAAPNDLPRDARFKDEKQSDLSAKYWRTLAKTGVGNGKAAFNAFNPLTEYVSLISGLMKKKDCVERIAAYWQEDAEFGRQFLNGVHPLRLTRVTSFDEKSSITEEVLSRYLDRGLTLHEEIDAGHVYILNYPEFVGNEVLPDSSGQGKCHIPSPICLFYVKPSGDLVPIAIQLYTTAEKDAPVWTPADDTLDWTLAKMWVKLADAHTHQLFSRQLRCHMIMEAVAIATMRNLPSMHPIFKLLIPHLGDVVAVNANTRMSLYKATDLEKFLAAGSHSEKFLRIAYQRFRLSDLHVPNELRRRGVAEKEKLPNYHFRDDASELWRILQKFVRIVVMLQYSDDKHVKNDEELQSWIRDLHDNGLPQWEGDMDHEVPSSIPSIDRLIDFLTIIIFTTSCLHSALTAGMMHHYGFCPNYPPLLRTAPPIVKRKIEEKDIHAALPNRKQTAQIVAACYTLAKANRDELFLGQYPENHFCSETISAAVEVLQCELEGLGKAIGERNRDLGDSAYTYLRPEKIPNSVAI